MQQHTAERSLPVKKVYLLYKICKTSIPVIRKYLALLVGPTGCEIKL